MLRREGWTGRGRLGFLFLVLAACSSSSPVPKAEEGANEAGSAGTSQGGTGGAAIAGFAGSSGHGGSTNCVEYRVDRSWGDNPETYFLPVLPFNSSLGEMGNDFVFNFLTPEKIEGKNIYVTYLAHLPKDQPKHNKVKQKDVFALGDAWSPRGIYLAVGYSGIFLGDPSKGSVLPVEHGVSSDWSAVHTAWDGEAFVVHWFYAEPDPEKDSLYASSRISEDGTLLQPLIPFGMATAAPQGIDATRFVTDPVSGDTYNFSGREWLALNGHHRDGTPFWPKFKQLLPYEAGVRGISAGIDPEGAWVLANSTWEQDGNNAGRLYRVHSDGAIEPPILFEPPEDEVIVDAQDHAIASRSAKEGWMVSSTYDRVYLWELEDGKAVRRRPVIDAKAHAEWNDSPDFNIFMGHISAHYVGEQWWLFLDEVSGGVVRLLRVDDPSCVYPSVLPVKFK